MQGWRDGGMEGWMTMTMTIVKSSTVLIIIPAYLE